MKLSLKFWEIVSNLLKKNKVPSYNAKPKSKHVKYNAYRIYRYNANDSKSSSGLFYLFTLCHRWRFMFTKGSIIKWGACAYGSTIFTFTRAMTVAHGRWWCWFDCCVCARFIKQTIVNRNMTSLTFVQCRIAHTCKIEYERIACHWF